MSSCEKGIVKTGEDDRGGEQQAGVESNQNALYAYTILSKNKFNWKKKMKTMAISDLLLLIRMFGRDVTSQVKFLKDGSLHQR